MKKMVLKKTVIPLAFKIPPFNIETVKLDDLLSLLNQPH